MSLASFLGDFIGFSSFREKVFSLNTFSKSLREVTETFP